jgi:hypothetical protein
VLVVAVEFNGPRNLLGRRVDLDRPRHVPHGLEHVASDLSYGSVRYEGDSSLTPRGAVLDQRLVAAQVKCDDDGTAAVRRGKRRRLPAPRGKAQGRVLELGLGWGEGDRELAEDLDMRVERVARLAPLVVVERGPGAGHPKTSSRGRRGISGQVGTGIGGVGQTPGCALSPVETA